MTIDLSTSRALFLRHPIDYDAFGWRWPNFRYEELECRDGTGLLLVPAALDRLQALRDRIKQPVLVASAYRSVGYNRAIGAAPRSMHLSGLAFDVHSPRMSLDDLARNAIEVGFSGIGLYRTFVHIDLGPRREWRG